jgi:predicted nicotinamide N-methyase
MKSQPPTIPDAALGDLVREVVLVEGRQFHIHRPDSSDLLLEYPGVADAFRTDEYMPYWAEVWPCARMLAKAILRHSWPPHHPALEIGCGLGLAGIAALSQGMHVTFSDYDPNALRFAANNARLNGFHYFQTWLLDWRDPPSDRRFPLILAADVCYEVRLVEPLLDLFEKILTDDGEVWLTDQDRPPAPQFRERLTQAGFTYRAEPMRAGVPGGERFRGTLYVIRRKKASPGPLALPRLSRNIT